MDASVILRLMTLAALGSVVVRWYVRFGHEDEEFPVSNTGQALDETFDAPAQFALDRQRVSQERAADGQQLPLPGQLGNPPSANSPHQV